MKKVIRKSIWIIGTFALFLCAYKVGSWIKVSQFKNRCQDNHNQGVFYPQENICVVSRIDGQPKVVSDYRLVGSWIRAGGKKAEGFILYEGGQIKTIGNLVYDKWKATNKLLSFTRENTKECYLYSFPQNDILVLRKLQKKAQECQTDVHGILFFSKRHVYRRMGAQEDK